MIDLISLFAILLVNCCFSITLFCVCAIGGCCGMRTKLVVDLLLYKYLCLLHQCYRALSNEDLSAYLCDVLLNIIYTILKGDISHGEGVHIG